jgi:hypothetical protein
MTDTERLRAALEWGAVQAQIRNAPEYCATIRDFIERGLPFLDSCMSVHAFYHKDDHEATLRNVAKAHELFVAMERE